MARKKEGWRGLRNREINKRINLAEKKEQEKEEKKMLVASHSASQQAWSKSESEIYEVRKKRNPRGKM